MNTKSPLYSRFSADQLILRDELAIDRTLLANERTLLAYLRSGVALLIAGATMIHFSRHGWFLAVGVACIPLGVICAAIGVARFAIVHRNIHLVRDRLPAGVDEGGFKSAAPDEG